MKRYVVFSLGKCSFSLSNFGFFVCRDGLKNSSGKIVFFF